MNSAKMNAIKSSTKYGQLNSASCFQTCEIIKSTSFEAQWLKHSSKLVNLFRSKTQKQKSFFKHCINTKKTCSTNIDDTYLDVHRQVEEWIKCIWLFITSKARNWFNITSVIKWRLYRSFAGTSQFKQITISCSTWRYEHIMPVLQELHWIQFDVGWISIRPPWSDLEVKNYHSNQAKVV